MATRPRLAPLALLLVVLAPGCAYEGLRSSASALRDEVTAIRGDLATVEDPAKRAKLQARLDEIAPVIEQLAAAVESAETEGDAWWELAEGLGLIFTGGVGAVGVRALRRILQRMAAQRAAIKVAEG